MGTLVVEATQEAVHRAGWLDHTDQLDRPYQGDDVLKPGVTSPTRNEARRRGLMRSYAKGQAKHSIRVNTIHPSGVATPMLLNPAVNAFREPNPAAFDNFRNPLPVELLDAEDISNEIVWLAYPARFVTGLMLPVDAGYPAQ